MSPRILALLLITAALLWIPFSMQGQSTQDVTVWEYRVLTLDGNQCAAGTAMATLLNAEGRQGWELVGFEAGPPLFSSTVEGSVALRAGAPNGRPDLYPQLADTIQGTVSFQMPQGQLGACELIFKRRAAAKP